jgi:long-chain acyl-CoA synthetase
VSTAPNTARRHAGSLEPRPAQLTIPEMFRRTTSAKPEKTALMHKVEGEYRKLSYADLADRVRSLALGLLSLGVEPGERVALLCENRPEWAVADLAILSIGAVNVPLYSTLPPPQVQYIVQDCGARVLIVSNEKQLDKALEIREQLPALKCLVVIDAPAEVPEGVKTLGEVMSAAAAVSGGETELQRRMDAVRPEDLASIIYTSGTTGAPKGAMLTHDNFMSNAQSASAIFEIQETDVFLSFLPLSHVFERMAGHYFPLLTGATIAYAESIFTVSTNMVEVKPTVMASVPRLYESIHSRISDFIARLPEARRKAAEMALAVGWEYHSERILGKSPGMILSGKHAVAESQVLGPTRERVTGGRLRFFISGGAPLPIETAKFLTSLGLTIVEGYGLTETSPVICANRPGKLKLGMVGPPITGVEVKIADDGEILSRGPHIMQGYFNQPEETAKAIDPAGWFATGDIGVLDEDGYLKITDRKKDIIVLANGKNVAPQPIEAKLKASPYVAQVVLFGDREPQIVALVVPDFEHLKGWARQQNLETAEPEELVKLPQVKKLYREEFARLSTDLADFEQVRRFTLLTRDFSADRGEMTPTLKIKRKVVAENYAGEIQTMYGGKAE